MDEDVIGNAAAAELVGVETKTWSGYVARSKGVLTPYRREISGGHALPVWKKSAIEAWQASRRGPGRWASSRSTDPTPAQ